MDFLPITYNDQNVYAGFWKRFCAGWIDAVIIIPLIFLFSWLQGLDQILDILLAISFSFLFAMYNVYFNGRFGGTPGKLLLGIRITKPDGTRIAWTEAWKRSAVDLVFAFINLVVHVWGILQIDPQMYSSMGSMERSLVVIANAPLIYGIVFALEQIWTWSEVVVLLFNKRRRALHDYIAGTVVVTKEIAEQARRKEDTSGRNGKSQNG